MIDWDRAPPTEEEAAHYYGGFMTSLFGLIDDAELSGYDPQAVALIGQARDLFWAECNRWHPNIWSRDEPSGG